MINVPLFKVFMSAHVDDPVCDVLHSGYIGEGQQVAEFESELSRHLGRHTLAVNSCTMGLMIALRLAQFWHEELYSEPATEVITQPITCSATNMAIKALGLTPIFADTNPDTCQMDPKSAQALMNDRTLTAIVTHWGGVPGPTAELIKAFKDEGIDAPVIGDAAHAFGATLDPREISAYSFQAIKHVTTGDGGAVSVPASPNEWLSRDTRLLRWFGLDRTLGTEMRCEQDPPFWGFKGHMNDIAASIGRMNLIGAPDRQKMAYANAIEYYDRLGRIAGVDPVPLDTRASYWMMTVMVDRRDDLRRKLNEHGIGATPVHRRNDEMTVFKDGAHDMALPGTDHAAARMLCLPVGWWVTRDDVQKICDIIESGW